MARPSLDLLHGTVDLLVLRTLAWEPMHGYGVAQFVKQRTDGAIALESAALYQALGELSPSPVIELNRAVAVGMAEGPAAGLALCEALADDPMLKTYHLLPAVRADFLAKLGRKAA